MDNRFDKKYIATFEVELSAKTDKEAVAKAWYALKNALIEAGAVEPCVTKVVECDGSVGGRVVSASFTDNDDLLFGSINEVREVESEFEDIYTNKFRNDCVKYVKENVHVLVDAIVEQYKSDVEMCGEVRVVDVDKSIDIDYHKDTNMWCTARFDGCNCIGVDVEFDCDWLHADLDCKDIDINELVNTKIQYKTAA